MFRGVRHEGRVAPCFWLTQHFQTPDEGGDGNHYRWKIYVDQRTSEARGGSTPATTTTRS